MRFRTLTLTPPASPTLRLRRCFSRSGDLPSRSSFMVVGVGAVVGAVTFGASTTATATIDGGLPTDVVLRDWNGVVIPVCSQCKARTKKVSANGGSSSTGAEITFTYYPDDYATFEGHVRIKIKRAGKLDLEVHSEYMTIDVGETVPRDLVNGVDWTWDEVDGVLVELTKEQ